MIYIEIIVLLFQAVALWMQIRCFNYIREEQEYAAQAAKRRRETSERLSLARKPEPTSDRKPPVFRRNKNG